MPEGVGYGPQNTASIGKEIHVIGTYAYAYSGFYTAADTTSGLDVLDFTTGNYYFVGEITFNGYAAISEPTYGTDGACQLKLNGEIALVMKNGTASEVMPTNTTCALIIPPYTNVNVRLEADGTNATVGASVVMTGKIHK